MEYHSYSLIIQFNFITMSNVNSLMPIERKLAAIMFTDIAGYTEQMSKDEDKAFALIQKKRELPQLPNPKSNC